MIALKIYLDFKPEERKDNRKLIREEKKFDFSLNFALIIMANYIVTIHARYNILYFYGLSLHNNTWNIVALR